MTDTKAEVSALLAEAKKYYGLQKEYLRYATAEQLTKLLSSLAIAIVALIVGLMVILFGGLALVHWAGALTGNIALCYAIFALLLLLMLLILYVNRRKWIVNPIARHMTSIFIKEDDKDNE